VKKPLVNAAFIDGNNLHHSTIGMGWPLDTKKFRRHLAELYGVYKAYYFIGHLETEQKLYDTLESRGYELVFKETYVDANGDVKGNIDPELILKAMTQYRVYKEAIIVTSDGDFSCLVEYLIKKNKLLAVIASSKGGCSHLLEKAAGTYISYMDELRKKLEYHKY